MEGSSGSYEEEAGDHTDEGADRGADCNGLHIRLITRRERVRDRPAGAGGDYDE